MLFARQGVKHVTGMPGENGGPGRIRTYDQGIRLTPPFPAGADYLFTPELPRSGAGRSSLSLRAL